MLDHFSKICLSSFADKPLDNRYFNVKYSYSDIFKALLVTYTFKGSCIENSKYVSAKISEKSELHGETERVYFSSHTEAL